MTAAAILMGAVATGAWLKYSTGAVIAAYEVGKRVEAIHQRTRARAVRRAAGRR